MYKNQKCIPKKKASKEKSCGGKIEKTEEEERRRKEGDSVHKSWREMRVKRWGQWDRWGVEC